MVTITTINADKMLLTLAASFQMATFHPAADRPFDNTYMPVHSTASAQFKPSHILVDNKLIELPYGVPRGVETLSSLIDIGNACLTGSRDITAEESTLVHGYLKKKYKKVQ
jgi:hypothetical protein